MVDLKNVARQKEEGTFFNLSNEIWKQEVDKNAEKALAPRFVSKNYL